MAVEVIMPKLEMAQETGTVVEWLKQEGDQVEQGEPILVIETDKVTMEVEAPGSGTLAAISAHPGDEVPIATIIAYILAPGEEAPEPAQAPAAQVAASPTAPPAAAAIPVSAEVAATPVARRMAVESGIPLESITGTGAGGKITKTDVEATLAATVDRPPGKVYATPAARRVARERGVDLGTMVGSGPDGRVQAADVTAFAAVSPSAVMPAVAPAAMAGEMIPLEGMRRTIAERMTASYRTAPHVTFTVRVDMSAFNRAREQLNARAEAVDGPRISATAMIVKAVALTLTQHPWLNSTLREDQIQLFSDVNVGVAVALDEGLIVPVVQNADRKGVAQIAAEVNDLAARAREGRLVPSDVAGGTFTVSNLGPFGIEQFTAIINPPQAAILAVGATQPEVVADTEGQIVVRPVMRMTLSADHRVVDGAIAAHFLADLREMLETPTLLLW